MARSSDIPSIFNTVSDVVEWRLCVGCGACASVCPQARIGLVNLVDQGIRPTVKEGDCAGCSDCLKVCPGLGASHDEREVRAGAFGELADSWGPILEVWEGYASDSATRHGGSSGGLASALATYCIEQGGMWGVLHISGSDGVPYENKSGLTRDRQGIQAATGSRYSPASPCDQFHVIQEAEGPCAFLGKPCDVQALRKAEALRPRLKQKVGVAIGIFCAGTPCTQGTLDLLRKFGVNHEGVAELRYRGRGWPGSFAVRLKNETGWRDLATYEDAWGFLQKYRPFRCYLCPDSTSEFADISCGDPWHRPREKGEPGRSLLLVRTERGRGIVQGAIRAGYIEVFPADPGVLRLSQGELALKRGAIWGRVATMRALGIPAPRFRGFSLFRNWLSLPMKRKVQSLAGTAKRIVVRRYFSRNRREGVR